MGVGISTGGRGSELVSPDTCTQTNEILEFFQQFRPFKLIFGHNFFQT